MKCIKYSLFIITFLLGAQTIQPQYGFAQKNSSAIKDLLEKRNNEIKELVGPKGTEYTEEQRNKLKDIINGIVDYQKMAQYALQETYSTLSQEEREEFINLFSTIIRDHSLKNLDIYRANVKYEQINVEADTAVVETLAQLKRVRTPVTYHMEYKNKEWVVTDIIIDDVSTANSYRRQFQNIINKKGYAHLLKTLRKKVSA
ncbi:MlaC/ttg2D family ABC transporter substrate-binding protein [Fodinibius saliphilus]|uniref:MlaC/ttg2D family ABC transporter substrate-binding protein n=1 Tax=Fodinibius saliphilus TaxID=1920650 RepID=UPI001108CCB3|nr:ABC transporter substrate-binding protein [Fodinibius saliphilus]